MKVELTESNIVDDDDEKQTINKNELQQIQEEIENMDEHAINAFIDSKYEIDDSQFKRLKYKDYFTIVFSISLFVFYGYIPAFRDFLIETFDYVNSRWDLGLIFYFFFVLPFVVYWAYLFIRIARTIWAEFNFLRFRILLTKIRFTFNYFGLIATIFCIITRLPLWNWISMLVVSIFTIILVNYLLTFTPIIKDQIVFEKIRRANKKEPVLIHDALLILFPILGILAVIYFGGDGTFKIWVNTFWATYFAPDLFLTIVFSITLILSLGWWAIAYGLVVLIGAFKKFREKIAMWAKFLIIMIYAYFIIKIIVNFLAISFVEPYATFSTLLMSGSLGLVYRIAKNRIIKNDDDIVLNKKEREE